MSEWNKRYVAYARAHGREPDAQLEHDREAWPGGKMAGFIIWITQKWSVYRATRKLTLDAILSDEDHRAFDAMIGAT